MRVVVYCGSSDEVPRDHLALGGEMGRLLAEAGHGVVFGGGRVGLMGTLSRGARAAGGRVVGVILDRFVTMGVGDPDLEEMVVTPTMRRRKEGLEERADAHLVLPGGVGTLDELFEILSLKYLGLNRNPLVILNHRGFFDPILAFLAGLVELGYLKADHPPLYTAVTTPGEALAALETGGGRGR